MKTITIAPTQDFVFDRELISSLPSQGPRYTSYPTADRFHNGFVQANYIQTLENTLKDSDKPVSLYIHIPFCNVICYYCGCNKVITKDTSKADEYLNYLEKEMALLKLHLHGKHKLAQLHFGGGTPTFLNDEQLERVFNMIREHFELLPDGEYSIEIDPRKVSRESVFKLAQLGFNRMSVGIQDFDPKVQAAVNRIQTVEETKNVIDSAREAGFKSISVDLIYGLPHQSVQSIKPTLDTVLSLNPDRLALYHYAHLPHIFKPQRRIDTNAVPSSEEKLDILQYAVQLLNERGYVFIGMDHFAKPEDELAIALREGRLQRNFQGYSTYADCDLVAIGVSSIGKIGNTYSQNQRNLEDYYADLDADKLPIMRGFELNDDDVLRRQIIQDLMCRFSLNFDDYLPSLPQSNQVQAASDAADEAELAHMKKLADLGIISADLLHRFKEIDQYKHPFADYFAAELNRLQELVQLGLVEQNESSLHVTPKGRFLIRNIAMVFDYYLHNQETRAQYSQTV
ncbi:oxygen-independent coproporphyrinogen III oxidase [Kingella kingae]|uniref:oxygen-independent coproporphyrinogen III oxidase n=1 Tax=Kingella kingae TaxID=504 RepID=UPI0002585A40|nr:oxygen-independent coproporphyrinogen III oxidase [Kingella kingae]EIC13552.1 coproporphyrinogen III oxidase [Kingella kingae PYKK081]MBD3614717.1 oxygen-independent coproporphyrinogen III oxidase [Kingella kingae]MBD3633081.1 oxygen-independent coproporphyrinogen III oxidase [Kingella kingae]MBD3660384.1 oxygen-independent coproporphyrinogen III oxidase [Kingella kingae]MDK4544863.1 oxygen-independent coproporphyrinogen III oxidase [Kingella kingae]